VSSARTDLCGGRSAMTVPTATLPRMQSDSQRRAQSRQARKQPLPAFNSVEEIREAEALAPIGDAVGGSNRDSMIRGPNLNAAKSRAPDTGPTHASAGVDRPIWHFENYLAQNRAVMGSC